ncbi:MAG: DNA topoisomerase I [Candidatus Thorarchaeota archaeon]
MSGFDWQSAFKTIVRCRVVPLRCEANQLSKVLIISEKPTAARRIAQALDENGFLNEVKKRGASYYECTRNGDSLIVVYALGHLFELRQTEKGWKYPRLSTEWVPKYEVDKKATGIKPIIRLIGSLSKDVDQYVVATDLDIEGSLIGYLALVYGCRADASKAKRMVFSTLTKAELESAYENLSPTLNFPMIEAGAARHEIDWLYGINLTRALTLAIKESSGWFKIVSTGRVQGPTLAIVAARDQAINTYVPAPYWTILTIGMFDGHDLELEYSKKRIAVKSEALAIVADLQGKTGTVDVINSKKNTQTPPVPFDLSALQSESYRHFGFKPSRTLAIAQKLYLEALISYPRTGSQKIPPSINVRGILSDLSKYKKYAGLAKQVLDSGNLTPVQGKKDDPAHPAIHPTGAKPTKKLTPSETKVFDLIVRRFFALFGEIALKESIRADIRCNEHLLYARGLKILKRGWMDYYDPYVKLNERVMPGLAKGDSVYLESVNEDGRFTSPPPRFNPSSLLKILEKENLGTKATRSSIVDSVKSRGYTLGDKFELSTLGYALHETLDHYVPKILSADFTRQLEGEMDGILEGRLEREQVLSHAREDLLELLSIFQSQEESIGRTLVNGLQRYWKEKEEIGLCPKCGVGNLIIIRSPKSGKRFVGCTQYKEGGCDQTFPLPQKGSILPLDKECPHCGHDMIKIIGRRTWETCVNWAQCPGRQEDLRELEKRREKIATKKEGTSSE